MCNYHVYPVVVFPCLSFIRKLFQTSKEDKRLVTSDERVLVLGDNRLVGAIPQ